MGRVLPIAPAAVPTLDELATDPAKAERLPIDLAAELQTRCMQAMNALWSRQLAARNDARVNEPREDTLLDVSEAAKRLSTSRDWLYRHAAALPFTVRNGRRQLRFSSAGITRYIREHQGAIG